MFVLSSFTFNIGVLKGCVSSNMCTVSLLGAILPGLTFDQISCTREMTTTAPTTGPVSTISTTTDLGCVSR